MQIHPNDVLNIVIRKSSNFEMNAGNSIKRVLPRKNYRINTKIGHANSCELNVKY